jgi:hypothetical protein
MTAMTRKLHQRWVTPDHLHRMSSRRRRNRAGHSGPWRSVGQSVVFVQRFEDAPWQPLYVDHAQPRTLPVDFALGLDEGADAAVVQEPQRTKVDDALVRSAETDAQRITEVENRITIRP